MAVSCSPQERPVLMALIAEPRRALERASFHGKCGWEGIERARHFGVETDKFIWWANSQTHKEERRLKGRRPCIAHASKARLKRGRYSQSLKGESGRMHPDPWSFDLSKGSLRLRQSHASGI